MDQISLTHDLAALAQVILIDVTLAGDNAIVVGMAVAGLPDRQKRPAIILGILGATVIRIALGAIALQLLAVIGLLLAGGLLLLWVCWKMFRELRQAHGHASANVAQRKTLRQAMTQIILADLSMSLDNVLAVAGAANGSTWVLMVGLLLSVVLMGVAANFMARVLERARWVAWIGLAIVLYVAVAMIWEGAFDVADAIRP
jgi:YjbE family integral membrane protein